MPSVRPAIPADIPTLLRFIREHADHVHSLDKAVATEADLLRDGWNLAPDAVTSLTPATPPRFRALIADCRPEPAAPPQPAGFALFFPTYSTWVGHHGLRLEDLYVIPTLRGTGVGKALLRALAQIAVAEGCIRLEWDVLTWNEPALAVYRHLGAVAQEDWRIMRLTGDALRTLAQ